MPAPAQVSGRESRPRVNARDDSQVTGHPELGVRGSQEPGSQHRKAQAKASSEAVKFKVAS